MDNIPQGDTFSSFEPMTERLVEEVFAHLRRNFPAAPPAKISFVGHSLGCILVRSAIAQPKMAHLAGRFHTFLSLSGPHLGTLYNNSGLVNMGRVSHSVPPAERLRVCALPRDVVHAEVEEARLPASAGPEGRIGHTSDLPLPGNCARRQ